MRFKYTVTDRRYGKRFIENAWIDATSRPEARKAILKEARRDQPRAARNNGYVPLRDWQINFTA